MLSVHPGEALEMEMKITVKFQRMLRRLTHESKLQENVTNGSSFVESRL